MPSKTTLIKKGYVYDIAFRCNDGEEGELTAYWTGEVDIWGKWTWISVDGFPPHYLFEHELRMVRPTERCS